MRQARSRERWVRPEEAEMVEAVALWKFGDSPVSVAHGEMMKGQRAPRSNDFLQNGRPKM